MSLPKRTRFFIVIVGLLALGGTAFYLRDFHFLSLQRILAFALFLILGFLSEIYAVWIPAYGSEISTSIAIYTAALFILGPSLTVVMVLVTTLASEILMRWEHLKRDPRRFAYVATFNTSQLVLAVSIAGLIFFPSGTTSLLPDTGYDFLRALGAFFCYAVVNVALVISVVSLSAPKVDGRRGIYRIETYIRDFSLQYLVLGTLALLLAVLYLQSIWHMLLAIVPLFLVHLSFRSYQRLRTEARKTFEKISRMLDERDHYTAVHSSDVAELAVQIAAELGLSQAEIEKVDIAARVHDIGKVAVPDAILLKPESLTDEEWEIMKKHPVVSAELIEGLEIYAPVADAVRHEHERWDGSGYPDGLKGEQIPMVSRVIAAADIHNALTTDRPYRPAFSADEAVRIIREIRGRDIDPRVADALLHVVEHQQHGSRDA